MLLQPNAVPASSCALPNLAELDPKKKTKAYITQYGRGYLWAYSVSGSEDFYRGRDKYQRADDYANGDNTVKAALKKSAATRDEASTAQIDFRPLPLLHKPLMSVEGLLKDHSYEATATPIDAASQDEQAEYAGRMRAWMEHQSFLEGLGNVPPGGPGADIPLDSDELDLRLEVNYKIREAIDLEQKIAFAFYLADYARQDQQCTRDETVKGVSVLYMARRGPRRLPLHLHPGDCFILPARSEDFPNLQAGAHLERLSLGQVLAEIADDPDTSLTETQKQALQNAAKSNQSSGSYAGGGAFLDPSLGNQPELAGQVDVVRFAFVSTDLEVQKEYINKFGNKHIRLMEAGYGGPQETNPGPAKDVQIHRKGVQNWYEGTLVLGTDISYGCRKAYEQLRDEQNPFACLPLYIVNAPGLVGKKIKSIVERCQPIVDTASRAFVKMNHTMAKWPDVYAKLNRDALLEAVTDLRGTQSAQQVGTAQALEQLFREGVVVANEVDDQGNPIGKAIEINLTPAMTAAVSHWNTIQQCKAEIADITGINGAISGDDPASRQGEGVTQLAISGSQNALNHLFVAKHSRFERAAKAIAASIKSGEDKGRAPLTGSMSVATRSGKKAVYVQPSPGIASRQFQLKIEQKPTEQQWQGFYAIMNNALVAKDITAGDVAFLYTVDNLKQARFLLDVRTKRNDLKKQQQAEAASKMQGEQATAAAQAKGEQDRLTDDHKTDNEIRVWTLRNAGALAVATEQKEGHVAAAALAQQGRLQSLDVTGQQQAQRQQVSEVAQHERHDAQLTSQEQQAAAQRAHEQQLAQQPVAA